MESGDLSSEELLSQVKQSFDVQEHEFINLLPLYALIARVAEWDGDPGEEPEWMLEADKFLMSEIYKEGEFEKFEITHEEFLSMSISERASTHNLFGILNNRQNQSRFEPQEEIKESLLPDVVWPEYKPSPASIVETDFAPDGSHLLRGGCNKCKEKSEFLNAKQAFDWVDSHNQVCK